ncbi:methyltransferase domain-containing protein [Nocardia nova]|uniref:methyltransferase domain-containing protein n=1 Tax=Nocardia nova TaxID=37330 RepID=UPI00379EF4FE
MSTSDVTQEYTDRDKSLIAQLDAAETLPAASRLRASSLKLLRLPVAGAVVDVGCGAGRAAGELAQRGHRVVGVDVNDRMITAARRRWPDVEFQLGDATALPLATNSMDGYRADKVFHEIAEPAAALVEARRVLAPGGRIVLLGQDWDALVIDSDDPNFTRSIVAARADTITNPRSARRYRNLLLNNGFVDVTIEVHTAIFTDATMLPMLVGLAQSAHATAAVTRGEADSWIAEQTWRADRDCLFLAVPMFLAAATNPV